MATVSQKFRQLAVLWQMLIMNGFALSSQFINEVPMEIPVLYMIRRLQRSPVASSYLLPVWLAPGCSSLRLCTITSVSLYHYVCAFVLLRLAVSLSYVCVFVLLRLCLCTTRYVSLYHYVCVFVPLRRCNLKRL